jgi:hypothetical protein
MEINRRIEMIKSTKKTAMASLELTELPAIATTTTVDPVMDRRNRIVTRLEEQKALIANPNLTRSVTEKGVTKQVKIRSWTRPAADGSVVFFVKAGFKPLELAKGKPGVLVPATDMLPSVIDTLIQAVRNGELDDALAAAAASSKRKPKAKA